MSKGNAWDWATNPDLKAGREARLDALYAAAPKLGDGQPYRAPEWLQRAIDGLKPAPKRDYLAELTQLIADHQRERHEKLARDLLRALGDKLDG